MKNGALRYFARLPAEKHITGLSAKSTLHYGIGKVTSVSMSFIRLLVAAIILAIPVKGET